MQELPKVDVYAGPFANGGDMEDNFPDTSSSIEKISYKYGIPVGFCVPKSNGGVKFTRQMMNRLGFMATQHGYLAQCGIPVTFSEEVSKAIGGYPKGAILKYIDISDTKRIVADVISLQENNKVDFTKVGVDGTNWEYVDHIANDFYPDMVIDGNSPAVTMKVNSSGDIRNQYECTMTGWVYVRVSRSVDVGNVQDDKAWSMFMSAVLVKFMSEYGGVGRQGETESTSRLTKSVPLLAMKENGVIFPVVKGSYVEFSVFDPSQEEITIKLWQLGTVNGDGK